MDIDPDGTTVDLSDDGDKGSVPPQASNEIGKFVRDSPGDFAIFGSSHDNQRSILLCEDDVEFNSWFKIIDHVWFG